MKKRIPQYNLLMVSCIIDCFSKSCFYSSVHLKFKKSSPHKENLYLIRLKPNNFKVQNLIVYLFLFYIFNALEYTLQCIFIFSNIKVYN